MTAFIRILAFLCFVIPLPSRAQIELTGIDHVAIHVASLDASAKWYEDRFGLKTLQQWKGVWMIGKGNVRLGLFLIDKPKTPGDISNLLVIEHFAFGVSADRFQAALDQFRAAKVDFGPVEDTGIAYSVFLTDPDGHQVELTTYHGKAGVAPK